MHNIFVYPLQLICKCKTELAEFTNKENSNSDSTAPYRTPQEGKKDVNRYPLLSVNNIRLKPGPQRITKTHGAQYVYQVRVINTIKFFGKVHKNYAYSVAD